MPENPFFKYAFSLMFIVIVILLLTDRGNALEQLENEGPIYGECKYITETVIEDGVEISRNFYAVLNFGCDNCFTITVNLFSTNIIG